MIFLKVIPVHKLWAHVGECDTVLFHSWETFWFLPLIPGINWSQNDWLVDHWTLHFFILCTTKSYKCMNWRAWKSVQVRNSTHAATISMISVIAGHLFGPGQEKVRLKILRPRSGPTAGPHFLAQAWPVWPKIRWAVRPGLQEIVISRIPGPSRHCYRAKNSSPGLARQHALARQAGTFSGRAGLPMPRLSVNLIPGFMEYINHVAPELNTLLHGIHKSCSTSWFGNCLRWNIFGGTAWSSKRENYYYLRSEITVGNIVQTLY
jgi:hypothetical protein